MNHAINDLYEDLLGLESTYREFCVTTAEGTTESAFGSIGTLLRRVRHAFGMDVVFVSEFVAGRRVFRHVDAAEGDRGLLVAGASDPLEESFCQRVVDGRLPEVIHDAQTHPVASALSATKEVQLGAHLSVPVVLSNGQVYGTLCCFSHTANPLLTLEDAAALRSVAGLVARAVTNKRAPTSS